MGGAAIDLTGRTFGQLTILRRGPNVGASAGWLCSCSCSQEKLVSSSHLTTGRTRSCGCQQYPVIDLTGQKFGRLTILRRGPNIGKNKEVGWICSCSCGEESLVSSNCLRRGNTKSCGCLHRKHGLSGTRVYHVWNNMMSRCYNEKHKNYHQYGGRGIKVCERWHDVKLFVGDVGQPPPGLTLERKNNERGYFPKNCCWATRKDQANNRRDRSGWTSRSKKA